ncbi:MAG: SUMF1/EgtB/PvdO family nonheme iron enzyme, partial [Chloroflexi bacterium]|nr:SUMF1/EgtB/PvdO family nonheme iron enzyme [Chloroflexota bacterium]
MEQPGAETYTLSDQPTDQDALDFGPYVRALVKIIQSSETATPLTIGVFGDWGSGKTSLMRMVRKELAAEYHTVWFDAWKYDKEDALWRALLLQVLAALRKAVEAKPAAGKDELEAREKALDALSDLEGSLYHAVEREELGNLQVNWRELLKGSVETALHVGVALVPGLHLAQAVMEAAGKKAVGDDPGALLKAVERTRTKINSEHVQSLEQFQARFQGLVRQHIPPEGKLVVFIDDLDRCMPGKAIEVLEAIKLFLDVERCIFLLGLDQSVVARGVEIKYRELGFEPADGEARQKLIDGARYLEKIIQLPFIIPTIAAEDMTSFVEGLVKSWPHVECPQVFARGLGNNPRQVKRTVNVFLLLWALAKERADRLKDEIKPVRLAKVVVIQNIYPELYDVLKRTPRLLGSLEAYYRAEQPAGDGEARLEEGAGAAPRVEPPPALRNFLHRAGVRQVLTMHPPEEAELSFRGLNPEELGLYFSLTRRAEAPLPPPAQAARRFFEPEMARVPAGPFLMGSTQEQIVRLVKEGMNENRASREAPQHTLELPEYWIGKYPVTNLEYQAFIKDGPHPPPRGWDGASYPADEGDHPVVNVSWRDSVAYCAWLSAQTGKRYTLPSEAEWEKAARGADGRVYPWGDDFDKTRCNTREGGHGDTSPVGRYSPRGDSPYGCADMSGNVWEWTRSLFGTS